MYYKSSMFILNCKYISWWTVQILSFYYKIRRYQHEECGRTAWNSTLTEVLVSHQTLSTPKTGYNERYPSGTPQGRTRKIHIFPKDLIMRTSYNTDPFHTSEVLKKYIITLPNIRVQNDKRWNLNKHLAIGTRIPSESTRRILHTKVLLMHHLQQG